MSAIGNIFQALNPPPEGWAIVILILAFAVYVGVGCLIKESRRLRKERSEVLNAARRVIETAKENDDVVSKLHQWAHSSELKDTLTAKAVRAVLAMREARNPDIESVLTMLDYGEASRLSLARNAPNWLLLIGIGGTVIGLASAVISLAPQIQDAIASSNPIDASNQMADTLQAMRHAFACSLWGIFSAVIMSLFFRKVSAEQQQTVAEVFEFVVAHMGAYLLPKSEAIQLESIQKTILAGQRYLQNVSQNLAQSAEAVRQTLDKSTQALLDATNSLVGSANQLQHSSMQLRDYHQELRSAYFTITQQLNNYIEAVENKFREQINEIAKHRSAILEMSGEAIQKLLDVSSQLGDTQRTFEEKAKEVKSSTMEICHSINIGNSNILEYLDKNKTTLEQLGSRLEQLNGTTRSLQQVAHSLDKFVQMIEQADGTLGGQDRNFSTGLSQAPRSTDAGTSQTFQKQFPDQSYPPRPSQVQSPNTSPLQSSPSNYSDLSSPPPPRPVSYPQPQPPSKRSLLERILSLFSRGGNP